MIVQRLNTVKRGVVAKHCLECMFLRYLSIKLGIVDCKWELMIAGPYYLTSARLKQDGESAINCCEYR